MTCIYKTCAADNVPDNAVYCHICGRKQVREKKTRSRLPKPRLLPSGTWNAQVFVGYKDAAGKRQRDYLSVSAATESECSYLVACAINERDTSAVSSSGMTLAEAIDAYISTSDSVLSPTTIRSYKIIKEYAFRSIINMPLRRITEQILNDAINEEMKRPNMTRGAKKGATLAPKTVINEYGLITAVLNKYAPRLDVSRVRLPEKKKQIKDILPPEEILPIIRGTEIELPVLLAMWLTFSMSEIRGLTKSKSINGDYITIRETVVRVDGKDVRKDGGKEYERVRRHRMPVAIKALIDAVDGDVIVPYSAASIYKRWMRLLEKHGKPHMTFHGLRHVSASVMAQLNVPDKYAQERGGWKTPDVYKGVYQHTFSAEREVVDDRIDSYFNKLLQDDSQYA